MKNMTQITRIGLDEAKSRLLADKLNVLLANYQVFYMNTRGFHWNIQGEKFFELHVKFEELYNDLILKIDEIAERVLTLGHTPIHTYTDYLGLSNVKEAKGITVGRDAIGAILAGFQKILVLERELLDLSDEADDEGTNALMSDYIREQEKLVWMYNAWMK